MSTLVEQLEARHRRRLANLRRLGPRLGFVVAVLGGARPGAEVTPEQLTRAFERMHHFGGDKLSLALLDQPAWLVRAVRALGEFHALRAQLRRLRNQIFSR